MDLKQPKFSKKEVSQKFNLKTLLGVDFSKDPDLRDQIGQAIIDKIIERTASGKDVRGRDFKAYSKEYKSSDDFKDYKSSSKVNMELRGRMLDDIDILSQSANMIKVGFEDELETLKAFNHNIGQTVPRREFFGIQKKELADIKREFRAELSELKKAPPKEKKQTIGDLITEVGLLGDLFGEG